MPRMLRRLILLSVAAVGAGGMLAWGAYLETGAGHDLQFVEDVLLTDRAGAAPVRRWTGPVFLDVFSDDPFDMRLVATAVAEFNDALKGAGMRVALESRRTGPANVDVVFAPRDVWTEVEDGL